MGEEKKWELAEGTIVGGRYKIGEEIGRGGMGVVYKGFDQKLFRHVAVKFLRPEYTTDAEAVLRFEREALAAGQIGHENICDVRDMGTTDEKVLYIVMELLQGEALSEVLGREKRVEVERAVDILSQVLSALAAVHEAKIIHRDLKPENIFLIIGADGRERVKLLDFGISKHLGEPKETRLTKTGNVLGSPFYMSPEQARGFRDIDCRTDLWSIGVVLYEMSTGKVPFGGEGYNEVLGKIITEKAPDPKIVAPDISDALAEVIRRALAWNLDERFVTAGEFATALMEAMSAGDPENTVEIDEEASDEDEEGAAVVETEEEEREESAGAAELPLKRRQWWPLVIIGFFVVVLGAVFGWRIAISPLFEGGEDASVIDADDADVDTPSDAEGDGDGATEMADAGWLSIGVVPDGGDMDGGRDSDSSPLPVKGKRRRWKVPPPVPPAPATEEQEGGLPNLKVWEPPVPTKAPGEVEELPIWKAPPREENGGPPQP